VIQGGESRLRRCDDGGGGERVSGGGQRKGDEMRVGRVCVLSCVQEGLVAATVGQGTKIPFGAKWHP